jgi:hypothetical protein
MAVFCSSLISCFPVCCSGIIIIIIIIIIGCGLSNDADSSRDNSVQWLDDNESLSVNNVEAICRVV